MDRLSLVEAYHEVCAYTLTLGDPEFRHQHVVDAWAAQHARVDSKPIAVCFALVGLYLHQEQGYTGREVQLVHMQLARQREAWPFGSLPTGRGTVTAHDVLAASAGTARNAMISRWVESVWTAYTDHSRAVIIDLLQRRGIIHPRR